jgi:hypothetical protein
VRDGILAPHDRPVGPNISLSVSVWLPLLHCFFKAFLELAANDLVFGSADHLRKRFVHVCVRAVRPRLSNAGMDPVEDEGEVPLALIENGTARTKLLLSLKIHSSQILQLTPELTNL